MPKGGRFPPSSLVGHSSFREASVAAPAATPAAAAATTTPAPAPTVAAAPSAAAKAGPPQRAPPPPPPALGQPQPGARHPLLPPGVPLPARRGQGPQPGQVLLLDRRGLPPRLLDRVGRHRPGLVQPRPA